MFIQYVYVYVCVCIYVYDMYMFVEGWVEFWTGLGVVVLRLELGVVACSEFGLQ